MLLSMGGWGIEGGVGGYQRQQLIKRPKLGPWLGVIDAILEDYKQRSATQRHTAKRIFDRLREEHQYTGGYA